MQDNPIVLGFSTGELSPWLSTRIDLSQYQHGAALLNNFFVEPYGGLRRRQGTRFVAQASSNVDNIKLFAFSFSSEDSLLLEFSPGKLRFFYEGELVRDSDGAIYSISTPWDSAEKINSMRLVQVNDIIFVASPHTPPMELQRYSNTNWKCIEMSFNPIPRNTYIQQSKRMIFKSNSTVSSTLHYDLSIESPTFNTDMEDAEHLIVDCQQDAQEYLRSTNITLNINTSITSINTNISVGVVFAVNDTMSGYKRPYTCKRVWYSSFIESSLDPDDYPYYFVKGCIVMPDKLPLKISGEWALRTTDEWNAHFDIRRSYDDTSVHSDYFIWNWVTLYSFYQNDLEERQNWAFSNNEDEPCQIAIYCTLYKSTSFTSPIIFDVKQAEREMSLLITDVYNQYSARGKVIGDSSGYPSCFDSFKWSFGAMGPSCGYARFMAFSEGRLWFGGINASPTTLMASCLDDFYNFRMGSNDDSALQLTLANDNQNRICWMNTAKNILLGTSESEWVLASPDGSGLSPSNATFSKQSSVGSEDMESNSVENSVFYVQRGGKRLREISYKLESDGFASTDISLLAEHLFSAGIAEWTVQRGGSMRVWVLMKDNSLAVLTSNVSQQVAAWQRVTIEGAKVLHIAVLSSHTSSDDELWLVLERSGADGQSPYLSIEVIEETDVFLDSHLRLEPNGGILSAPHLAGEEVICHPINQLDEALTLKLDTDGNVNLSTIEQWNGCTSFMLGKSIKSELQTMPLEFTTNFNAVSQLGRVKVRLLNSEPNFFYKASHLDDWNYYDSSRDHLVQENFTGAIRVSHMPSPSVAQGICLRSTTLRPFNLLAISVERDFHGK